VVLREKDVDYFVYVAGSRGVRLPVILKLYYEVGSIFLSVAGLFAAGLSVAM
jgi:hypothetical protein